jgi:hypothetical protein
MHTPQRDNGHEVVDGHEDRSGAVTEVRRRGEAIRQQSRPCMIRDYEDDRTAPKMLERLSYLRARRFENVDIEMACRVDRNAAAGRPQ